MVTDRKAQTPQYHKDEAVSGEDRQSPMSLYIKNQAISKVDRQAYMVQLTQGQAFPRFKDLPPEIRDKIWRLAIPERRIICLEAHCLCGRTLLCQCDSPDEPFTTHLKQDIPALLHTNFEARQIAAPYIGRLEGYIFDKRGIFHACNDILYCPSYLDLARIARSAYTVSQRRVRGEAAQPHCAIILSVEAEKLLRSVRVLAIGSLDERSEYLGFIGAMLSQFTSLKMVILPEPFQLRSSKAASKRAEITRSMLQMFREFYEQHNGKKADEDPKIYFLAREQMESIVEDSKVQYTTPNATILSADQR